MSASAKGVRIGREMSTSTNGAGQSLSTRWPHSFLSLYIDQVVVVTVDVDPTPRKVLQPPAGGHNREPLLIHSSPIELRSLEFAAQELQRLTCHFHQGLPPQQVLLGHLRQTAPSEYPTGVWEHEYTTA